MLTWWRRRRDRQRRERFIRELLPLAEFAVIVNLYADEERRERDRKGEAS